VTPNLPSSNELDAGERYGLLRVVKTPDQASFLACTNSHMAYPCTPVIRSMIASAVPTAGVGT